MSQSVFIGMAAAGVVLSATGIYLFKKIGAEDTSENVKPVAKGGNPSKSEKTERLLLSNASDYWTDKQIPLSEACKFWVNTEEDKQETGPRPIFSRNGIDEFYADYVEKRTYISGQRKAVITRLLKLLDSDGGCPSVVRNKKHPDAENQYTEDVFALLAEVPLWEHSLNVARHVVQRVGRETLIPDAMIAALGHDIGKIPAYHDKGYSTGDHPIISAIVLAGLSEFKQLSSKDEIEQVIRNHHSKKPPSVMASLLKTCDQLVRNQEIASKLKHAVEDEREAIEATGQEAIEPTMTTNTAVGIVTDHTLLPQPEVDPDTKPDHPMGHTSEKEITFKHSRVELPWLSLEALLTELISWVNLLIKDRWGAVSMPDGIVYVNHDCLWGVLKKIAPANPTLLTADADESSKRNILYSVVWTLSEKRNAIAAEMIGPGYYMIPVTIVTGTGKRVGGSPLLIPFKAEAFGVLPSALEKMKSPELWKMVKSIKPKANNY